MYIYYISTLCRFYNMRKQELKCIPSLWSTLHVSRAKRIKISNKNKPWLPLRMSIFVISERNHTYSK